MSHRIKLKPESIIDQYAALCLAMALVILSFIGVGELRVTALLGLILCAAGVTQDSARVDLRILIPLIIYDLAAMVSSYAAYGNIVDGYGAMHALFPVIYLLMACLDGEGLRLLRRCCVLWAGCAAVIGLIQLVFQALTQGWAGRLSGPLGNPNPMGIFLVLGWFAVMQYEQPDTEQGWDAKLRRLEPIILAALAATLSMGSFLAMAVGILVLLIEKKRAVSWSETFRFASRILARAVLGMGTGMLIYLAAARTSVPWSCLFLLAYAAAVTLCWTDYKRFLEARPRMAVLISALGILIAAAAVAVRPSAFSTFAERLEMMRSGLDYLTASPLLGIGPMQWRALDMYDGGKYFNTWHIHNIPIHIGVEMGWIAMAAVIIAGLCALLRRKSPSRRAGTAAFLLHSLIDTGFFYLGVTALVVSAEGEPETGGSKLNGAVVKLIFALFAVLFAYSLYYSIRGA